LGKEMTMTREAPSVPRKEKETVPEVFVIQRAEELIQSLIATLEQLVPQDLDTLPKEEVLLDRIIGRSHYVLIRTPAVPSDRVPLSPRENEIVRMVARGHSTKVIADVLNISCWTVSAHLRRIFTKLGVTSRPAMIARLAEEGFGRVDDRMGSIGSSPVAGRPESKPQVRKAPERAFSKSSFSENSVVFSNGEAPKRKAV
jgi:DNA-binding CsgD family transcriptional regulator